MLLAKFAVCDSENVRFIKEQESSGLLKSLGIKILFIKILLVGPLLFYGNEMNEMVNKLLLAGGKSCLTFI